MRHTTLNSIVLSLLICSVLQFTASSLARPATAGTVIVTAFGAKGDGITDDYNALKAAAKYLCSHPGLTLEFPQGTYHISEYRIDGGPNANGVTDIIYDGCSNVKIIGVGAKIDVNGSFHRSFDYTAGRGYHYSYTNGVIPFNFQNSSGFTVEGFELNGNVDKTTRDPGVAEGNTGGIWTGNCHNYTISGVYVHHFAMDGLYLGSGLNSKADTNGKLNQVTSTNNARQGLSIIQVRGLQVLNSVFSNTGRTGGSYGNHAPSDGADVEPNAVPPTVDLETGGILFQNCIFEDNLGVQLACDMPQGVDSIDVEGSLFEAESADDYTIAFCLMPASGTVNNCTFNVSNPRCVLLTGVSGTNPANLPYFKQMVFSNNVFNVQDNAGVLSDPGVPKINVDFTDNRINVFAPGPDKTYLKLRNLALVQGNTIYVDAKGYSGAPNGAQYVLLYDGSLDISGNKYETDLCGAAKYLIFYPPQGIATDEMWSENFN